MTNPWVSGLGGAVLLALCACRHPLSKETSACSLSPARHVAADGAGCAIAAFLQRWPGVRPQDIERGTGGEPLPSEDLVWRCLRNGTDHERALAAQYLILLGRKVPRSAVGDLACSQDEEARFVAIYWDMRFGGDRAAADVWKRLRREKSSYVKIRLLSAMRRSDRYCADKQILREIGAEWFVDDRHPDLYDDLLRKLVPDGPPLGRIAPGIEVWSAWLGANIGALEWDEDRRVYIRREGVRGHEPGSREEGPRPLRR